MASANDFKFVHWLAMWSISLWIDK